MTTNFVDGSTVITAAWLNSVEAVREGIDAPTGKAPQQIDPHQQLKRLV